MYYDNVRTIEGDELELNGGTNKGGENIDGI